MKKYYAPRRVRKPPGGRIGAMLSLLLVVATFFSAIPVHAEEFESNGMGGGLSDATSTASGSYKGVGDFEAAGYRFSMVGPTGTRVKDPYDVFEDGWVSSYAQSTTRFFTKKFTKLEIASNYTTYIDTYSHTPYSKSNFYSNTYNVSDSDLGITLPSTAEDMETWGEKSSNIEAVVSALWKLDDSEVFSKMASNGWYLLIEPIYYIKAGGQFFAGTVTELALLSVADGTAYSSVSWTAVPSYSTDANSWAFISGYTHAEWPMSLYLESDISDFGMDAPSKTLSKTSRGTSKLIITEGYGIMAISASADDIIDSTLTIDPNGGTYNGVIITRQPGSVTVASGSSLEVSCEATGDGLTYQWYYASASSSSFSKSSITTNVYTLSSMTSSRNGRKIYCLITDSYGNSVKTNTVTLNIAGSSDLYISRQPGDVAVPTGETAAFSFDVVGSDLTYTWYYRNAGASVALVAKAQFIFFLRYGSNHGMPLTLPWVYPCGSVNQTNRNDCLRDKAVKLKHH